MSWCEDKSFFLGLLKKEIRGRYLSSNLGALWLFLQPLAMLIIYQFVFEKIFKIRFPGMEQHGFLFFVAVGLWPWFAFSEGLMSATRALEKHADLLKKIHVNKYLLVLVEVAAAFCVHFAGFSLILLLFFVFGGKTISFGVLLVPILWLLLLLMTYGMSLLLSSLQVFLRDVAQVVQTVLMLWFYLTPIVYPLSLVPAGFRQVIWLNPLAEYVMLYRFTLLDGTIGDAVVWLAALMGTLLWCLLGLWVFGRLKTHFEDVL